MTDETTQGSVQQMPDADFDALYRGESPFEDQDFRFDTVPWDIGEPQPRLVELERSGQLRGDVLDSGCGLGENAVFLAERGHRVTGVDGAPTAIRQAEELARSRGLDIEFAVADVTRLDGFEQRFDTVVDSALYHCLDDEQRQQYSEALHRVTRPGAELHLFCFADVVESLPGPAPVSKDNLNTNLGRQWDIASIELTSYTSAFTRDSLRELASRYDLERLGLAFNHEQLETDERGRILMPVWQLRAVRR